MRMCGIYEILNSLNGKRYIGKSVNIKDRLIKHRCLLNRAERSKDENRHLFNSVKKYGISNFKFYVVELVEDRELLAERELYWMDYFKTNNRKFGYNLRRDSSSGMEVSKETKRLISEQVTGSKNPNFGNRWTKDMKKSLSSKIKEQFSSGVRKIDIQKTTYKAVEARNKNWEKDPTLKKKMAMKISEARRVYNILRLDYNTLEVLEEYEGRLDLKNKHPDYYIQAILGCCGGSKKSYKGYKWRYRKICTI